MIAKTLHNAKNPGVANYSSLCDIARDIKAQAKELMFIYRLIEQVTAKAAEERAAGDDTSEEDDAFTCPICMDEVEPNKNHPEKGAPK